MSDDQAKSGNDDNHKQDDEIQELFDQLFSGNLKPGPRSQPKSVRIEDEIARREKLKNDNTEQDINLKKNTLSILFVFLALETLAIFFYAYWQATNMYGFRLEEWSFRLLVSATITQITIMLLVAVRYLFPTNTNK